MKYPFYRQLGSILPFRSMFQASPFTTRNLNIIVVGDAKLRTQMRAEIKHLHKRLGVTSIYVTHDQVEAMTLADRIVVMNDGRIEQIGIPMDLFNHPVNTFVAGFIGSPPMNQFKAVVGSDDDGPTIEFAGTSIRSPRLKELQNSIGRKVTVGIRPEHASIKPIDGGGEIPIELDLIEPLGSEALLHAHIGEIPFVAKAETHGDIGHLNDVKKLHVNLDLIKIFDGETGLAYGQPKAA